jgi:small neutral amino acid transporter SnatA (MarC family)
VTRHERFGSKERKRSIFVRKRFQFATSLVAGAIVPWLIRAALLPASMLHIAAGNALIANAVAVIIAFWTRLSVETYPGIRRSYVILPSALTGHGIVVAWFLMTRFPYDRVALALGFLIHVLWLYLLYMYGERRVRTRIAVVPFGAIERLFTIRAVEWVRLEQPQLGKADGCEAIVADFSADLPDEWEAFLADAALAGRIVYQHKQLAESLTGRVELEQLSENSFGSLVPARGYFHSQGAGRLPVRAGHPSRGAAADGSNRNRYSCRQQGTDPVPAEARRTCRPQHHRLQIPNHAAGRSRRGRAERRNDQGE